MNDCTVAQNIIEHVILYKSTLRNCLYTDSFYDPRYEVDTTMKIRGYYEPFCGMLNVYKHIPDFIYKLEDNDSNFKKLNMVYKASDINTNVIRLFKGMQNGFVPPSSCTLIEYKNLLDKDTLKSIYLKNICNLNKNIKNGEYDLSEYKNNLIDTYLKIKNLNICFKNGEYDLYTNSDLPKKILKGYIIYCDPPKNDINFKIGNFIDWCMELSKYNYVYIKYDNYIQKNSKCKNFINIYERGNDILYFVR